MVSCAYLFCDLGYYKLIKVYLFTKKSPLEIKVHIKIVRQKHKMGENMSLKHAPAYQGKVKKKSLSIFLRHRSQQGPTGNCFIEKSVNIFTLFYCNLVSFLN